jgi:2-polyprenyl-3-methyl-5-hydroxy-6-metoxy-1,4-benzoquinol methylase
VSDPESKTYAELVEEELGRCHMARCPGVRDYVLGARHRGEEIAAFVAGRVVLEGKRALDVGTGDGGAAVALARRKCLVVAFDNSWENAIRARQLAWESQVTALFLVMDAQHAALAQNAFDVVICADVLEHVDRPDKVVSAMAGSMKPGGLCYVSVPNRFSPWNVLRDQHYRLFGLSLMPQRLAAFYVTRVRKRSTIYAVKSSFTWHLLRKLLSDHRISPELCGEFRSLKRLDNPELLIDPVQRSFVKMISLLRLKPLVRRMFLSRIYRHFLAPDLVCVGRKAG